MVSEEDSTRKRDYIAGHIAHLLRIIEGLTPDEPLRQGLEDTPKRVAKAYDEWFSGYGVDGKELLVRQFEDDVIEQYRGMVIVKGVQFQSQCEHHMAPFYGVAHVGYIPERINGDKTTVVGISKFARLVEVYSRRLQVQERMTEQITNDIDEVLKPKGVMVVVSATHTCMTSRGVRAHNTSTITSAVRGVFLANEAARLEFLELIKHG